MKLPNGYGSVTKLSGNRRRPYFVKKTIGYNEKGHPIPLPIGYAKTREEGLLMLAEYNKNPYDVDQAKITMKELYHKYIETSKYEKSSKSTKQGLRASFNKLESLHDMFYKDIKSYHMQEMIDDAGGYSVQRSMKTFWIHMDKYAMKLDIIDKMYSNLITVDTVDTKVKVPFSEEEIKVLWDNQNNYMIKYVLVLLYTGFRIAEFIELKPIDVDLENKTITGGLKTVAGKNRVVPIHHKILPFVTEMAAHEKEYLVTINGENVIVNTFRKHFKKELKEISMVHIPHETRHTFRTRLDNKNANKVSIDLIMGHSSGSIGERVYTHKTIEQLKETIELLDWTSD